MSYFILSILLAFWFQYEFKRFPKQINLQTYRDFLSLYPLVLSEDDFLKESRLQLSNKSNFGLLCILFILSSILFTHQSITLLLIVLCLIYLSLLDYCYYLTDIKYVGLISVVSLLHLILYKPYFIQEGIATLLVIAGFFSLFHYISKWVFKREVFGLGDILLIISVSPIFNLEEMFRILLISSLFGILFGLFYFLRYHRKLEKLAFIPFISASYFITFAL